MEKYEFSFLDYSLAQVNFRLNETFDISSEEIEINPVVIVDYTQEEKIVKVFLSVDIDGKNTPFSMSIKGRGFFEFKETLTSKRDLDSIVNINCAAIIFPFMREHIADLTRKAGFPALLLPPMNFVRLYGKSKKRLRSNNLPTKKKKRNPTGK